MTLLPLNWLKMRVSAKKKCYKNPSDVMYSARTWSSWIIPADIVETWVRNCTARFYNHHSIWMRSYLSKEQLQIQSTETSFCIWLWSNNQVQSVLAASSVSQNWIIFMSWTVKGTLYLTWFHAVQQPADHIRY